MIKFGSLIVFSKEELKKSKLIFISTERPQSKNRRKKKAKFLMNKLSSGEKGSAKRRFTELPCYVSTYFLKLKSS